MMVQKKSPLRGEIIIFKMLLTGTALNRNSTLPTTIGKNVFDDFLFFRTFFDDVSNLLACKSGIFSFQLKTSTKI